MSAFVHMELSTDDTKGATSFTLAPRRKADRNRPVRETCRKPAGIRNVARAK